MMPITVSSRDVKAVEVKEIATSFPSPISIPLSGIHHLCHHIIIIIVFIGILTTTYNSGQLTAL